MRTSALPIHPTNPSVPGARTRGSSEPSYYSTGRSALSARPRRMSETQASSAPVRISCRVSTVKERDRVDTIASRWLCHQGSTVLLGCTAVTGHQGRMPHSLRATTVPSTSVRNAPSPASKGTAKAISFASTPPCWVRGSGTRDVAGTQGPFDGDAMEPEPAGGDQLRSVVFGQVARRRDDLFDVVLR